MSYTLERSVAPTSEPVTVEELKAHARIDGNYENDTIEAFVTAARDAVEKWCERSFMPQTWRLRMPDFDVDEIPLRYPPVQSVTSITYVDTAGASQTLAADQYEVDLYSQVPRIVPAYNITWPGTRGQPNDVVVTYVTGYDAEQSPPVNTVPEPILLAIKMLATRLYEHRGDAEDPIHAALYGPLPWAAALLAPYRIHT